MITRPSRRSVSSSFAMSAWHCASCPATTKSTSVHSSRARAHNAHPKRARGVRQGHAFRYRDIRLSRVDHRLYGTDGKISPRPFGLGGLGLGHVWPAFCGLAMKLRGSEVLMGLLSQGFTPPTTEKKTLTGIDTVHSGKDRIGRRSTVTSKHFFVGLKMKGGWRSSSASTAEMGAPEIVARINVGTSMAQAVKPSCHLQQFARF